MLLRMTAKQLIALLLCLFLLTVLVPAALAEDAPAPGDAPAAETAEDGTTAGEEEGIISEEPPEASEPNEWETRLLLMLQEHNANPATITAGYYNFATGEEHFYNGDEYTDDMAWKYYNRRQEWSITHPETRILLEKLLVMLKDEGEFRTLAYMRWLMKHPRSSAYVQDPSRRKCSSSRRNDRTAPPASRR